MYISITNGFFKNMYALVFYLYVYVATGISNFEKLHCRSDVRSCLRARAMWIQVENL